MKYCEFDHNLDKKCGKPDQMKLMGMYLCPEHFDYAMTFLERCGINPLEPHESNSAVDADELADPEGL